MKNVLKKVFGVFLVLLVFILASCKKDENLQKIKIIVPNGTPLVAVGDLLSNENYEFEVVSGADLLTAALVKKDYDVVIAPITASSKLYLLKGIEYKFAAVITTGNNYLVTKGSSDKISDVNGKKIIAYGMNNTPDIVMKAALELNNITADIEYQSSVNDVVPFFVNSDSEYDYILTAEPTLTMLKLKYNLDLNVIDLQKELESEIEMIPQAGIFVLNNGKDKEIKNFLKDVKANIEFLNNNSDKYYEKVSNNHEYFTKLGEEVLEASLKTSNIKYYGAKENIETINKYYDLLNKYNNALLNGKTPDENFYY